MQLIEYSETEDYILMNIANGCDIQEEIDEFGIEVVDALATKTYDKACSLRSSVESGSLSAEEERKHLRYLLGLTLNLQRMQRIDQVKQLFSITSHK